MTLAAWLAATSIGPVGTGFSQSVHAQGRVSGGRGRGQIAPGPALTPREIQAQFEAYAIRQAHGALRLSEQQIPRFVPRARALQAVRRQSRQQRNRMIAQINRLLRAPATPDEARLEAATRELDDHDRRTLDEIQKAYSSLDEVLTPWQRARFRVLEDQLEQRKVQMLMRATKGPPG